MLEQSDERTYQMMTAVAGETVLLSESGSLRWVRIVHAAPVRSDGTQRVTVQICDQYGRSKPRPVILGSNAKIEWVS